jgi:predicted MFS family arabinose efflux permease
MVVSVAGYQLNATMLAPALPDVITRLHTTSAAAGLGQTMFFLFAALGQVTIARLSDYLGLKRCLLATLVSLAIGEILCATAVNIEMFIVGRIIEGNSAAAFTLAYLILHESLDEGRFGRALGIITAINGGIAGVDAIAAGALADHLGFRGIFVVCLVVTLAALVAVQVLVRPDAARAPLRLDWPGATLLSLGLTGLLLALNQGSSWGWLSPAVLVLLIGGGLCLVRFVLVERASPDPIIDVALLASRLGWPLLLTTIFTLAGAFAAANFTIPLLSQDAQVGYRMSAVTSALMFLAPSAVVALIAAPLAGHLGPRIGWVRLVRAGAVGSVVLFIPLLAFPGSPWVTSVVMALLGATFLGCVMTGVSGLAVICSPGDKPGSLPGVNGSCFGLGVSLGIAVAASTVTALSHRGQATFAGYYAALWAAGGFVLLALITALLIKPPTRERTSDAAARGSVG